MSVLDPLGETSIFLTFRNRVWGPRNPSGRKVGARGLEETALHLAAEENYPDVCFVLPQTGSALVDAEDAEGRTALHRAAFTDQMYKDKGVRTVPSSREVFLQADVILKVPAPERERAGEIGLAQPVRLM